MAAQQVSFVSTPMWQKWKIKKNTLNETNQKWNYIIKLRLTTVIRNNCSVDIQLRGSPKEWNRNICNIVLQKSGQNVGICKPLDSLWYKMSAEYL